MMAVSLYTSRVVLNTLGVEDFGIYNVVGGFVAMFTFLNTSMSAASVRFLNYEMGKGNEERVRRVFCMSLNIHFIIAFAILILAETIGLWFFYTHMQIPDDRMVAAAWTYQLAILSTMVMVISVPYNAAIIAHEKMGAFAYISILEVTLKLLIVYLLVIGNFDKLILYSILMFSIQLLLRFIYGNYCRRHFNETSYHLIWDKSMFKSMSSFAGWDLYGNMSVMARTQGVNVLLNVFFGPVANAASGIATRVQAAVMGFAMNVITAVRPQVIKSYSVQDFQRMNFLLKNSAYYIFLLLLALSAPIVIEAPYILKIWLKTVPDNAVVFCRLTLMFNLFAAVSSVVMIGIHATGRVKLSSFVNGTLYLSVVPICYVLYKVGCPPQSAYIINVVSVMIGMTCNVLYLHKYIPEFEYRNFLYGVYSKMLMSIVVISAPCYCITLAMSSSFIRMVMVAACSLVISIAVFFASLNKEQRLKVKQKIKNKWKSIRL